MGIESFFLNLKYYEIVKRMESQATLVYDNMTS